MAALRRRDADARLIAVSELLSRQTSRDGVFDALAEETPRVIGGASAVVLLRVGAFEGGPTLEAHPKERFAKVGTLPLAPFLPLGAPGLVARGEARAGARFGSLLSFFDHGGAHQIAYAPLGERGVLALMERREDRSFDPEDWFRLNAVARSADAALDRLTLREEAEVLALTDRLTGLGNRRKLEVLAPHHLASARRGTSLALVWFDLDGSAPATDEALQRFGECLLAEARGSDVIVRYQGAEFVALLPGSGAAGAERLASRVRARSGSQPLRLGLSEYGSETSSFALLLEQAMRGARAVRTA